MRVMKALSDHQAEFFMVVAETIVPEVARLDATARARMRAIVDAALMDRDAGTRRQIGSFLGVLRLAPVVRYSRPFDHLDEGRRAAVLRWFQECPVGLLRKGFWALKTLVFMGYYGQPECWPSIGYAPGLGGRSKVRHA